MIKIFHRLASALGIDQAAKPPSSQPSPIAQEARRSLDSLQVGGAAPPLGRRKLDWKALRRDDRDNVKRLYRQRAPKPADSAPALQRGLDAELYEALDPALQQRLDGADVKLLWLLNDLYRHWAVDSGALGRLLHGHTLRLQDDGVVFADLKAPYNFKKSRRFFAPLRYQTLLQQPSGALWLDVDRDAHTVLRLTPPLQQPAAARPLQRGATATAAVALPPEQSHVQLEDLEQLTAQIVQAAAMAGQTAVDRLLAAIDSLPDRQQRYALHKQVIMTFNESQLKSEALLQQIAAGGYRLPFERGALIHDGEYAKLHRLKQQWLALEKELLGDLQRALRSLAGDVDGAPPSLRGVAVALAAEASELYGQARYEIIHSHPAWNPNTPYALQYQHATPDYEGCGATCVWTAQGPAYTSAAPRDRHAYEEPVLPNYMQGLFAPSVAGSPFADSPLLTTAVSRAAVPSEFALEDRQRRAATNRLLVKQALNKEAADRLAALQSDGVALQQFDRDHPLVVEHTTVSLLTPNLFSRVALALGLLDVSKQERRMAKESLSAHRHWDGHLQPWTVVDPASGQQHTVFVRYKVNFVNIPNNRAYERMPAFLNYSRSMARSFDKSWEDLQHKTQARMVAYESDLKGLLDAMPDEDRKPIAALLDDLSRLRRLRSQVTETRIKENGLLKQYFKSYKKERKSLQSRWQELSDVTATTMNRLYDAAQSDAAKAALKLLFDRELLFNAFADIDEMVRADLNHNFKALDDNRYAMSARYLLLAQMLGENVLVHCRSAKDRTGAAIVEAFLVQLVSAKQGRYVSFAEMERLPHIDELRMELMEKTGSNKDLVEAFVGAAIGLNLAGAPLTPKKLSKAVFYRIKNRLRQGAAATFVRPKARHVAAKAYPTDDRGIRPAGG